MTVSKTTLLAILRAGRPKFKSREARLAYAVHAYLLAQGYKTVATGRKADETPPEQDLTEETGDEGWDEMGEDFAFRYLPEDEDPKIALQLRMQKVGSTLLMHWAPVSSDEPPESLELPIGEYTTDLPELEKGYKSLDKLLQRLDVAFQVADAACEISASGVKVDDSGRGSSPQASASPFPPEGPSDDRDAGMERPLWGGTAPGFGGGAAPREAPGSSDLVPPGLRAPGTSGGFSLPHIDQSGPGLRAPQGGGMHVGPGDPLYAGRAGRGWHPEEGDYDVRPPPGVRFDPIAPQGLPGWNPGDFQRPRPGQGPGGRGQQTPHPDIQPPGPGRGTDFTSMFG